MEDGIVRTQNYLLAEQNPVLPIYDISNYTFGTKESQVEEDTTIASRLSRLQEEYEKTGMRRGVDAVFLVHDHKHPHVLLVQIGSSFFKLPGGNLGPDEDEIDGLASKLTRLLVTAGASVQWNIGECLSTWWRPNFENNMYPYVPVHITHPKERRRVFLVHPPEQFIFSIPKNLKLVAVPLYDLHENGVRYGPIISAIPHVLSRFHSVYY